MTADFLYSTAGAILAVLFEYVPGLSAWYNNLEDNYQRLVMLGSLVVVVAGCFALSCYGKLSYFTCDEPGAWQAVTALVAAIMGNQATHRILPKGS